MPESLQDEFINDIADFVENFGKGSFGDIHYKVNYEIIYIIITKK